MASVENKVEKSHSGITLRSILGPFSGQWLAHGSGLAFCILPTSCETLAHAAFLNFVHVARCRVAIFLLADNSRGCAQPTFPDFVTPGRMLKTDECIDGSVPLNPLRNGPPQRLLREVEAQNGPDHSVPFSIGASADRHRDKAVHGGANMIDLLRRLWPQEEAQDIAEYAVMLAVILVLVVGTIRLIGGSANNVFSQTASSIGQ